ncbi:MAG: TonB-dependent receptor [Coleofasciculus sp. S288]|nr:TonB-dependent receptor [Coleofasciculus sp. S288]
MKLYLPFFYAALVSIGIMPPVVAKPLIFEADATPNLASAVPIPEEEIAKTSANPPSSQSSQSPNADRQSSITEIPRLSEIKRPLTSVEGLFQESLPTTADSSPIAQVEAEVVKVTGVRLNSTGVAFEVILETSDGTILQASTSTEDNTLIADIPNAVLALPGEDEFRADNPAEGITLVTVTQVDANRIRVAVTGETAVPTVQVPASESGLVLSVTPSVLQEEAEVEEEIEIVVTATRTEQDILNVPRSVTVITRDEIEQQSKLTPNLFDILGNTVPGFGAPNQSDRNNAQTLRGRNALILIDGVPLDSNLIGSTGLRGFDPSIVERIEVVNGPTGIYGSGATGGVINIITRRPEEDFTVRAELGVSAPLGELQGDSFAYDLGAGISGTEGDFDYLINLAAQFTNQFYDAEGDRIPQDVPTLAESTVLNGFGRLGFDITDEQRLQLSVNHARDRRDVNYLTDPTVRDIPGRQKARALEIDLDFGDLERPGNVVTNIDLNYAHDNLLGSRLQAQAYYYNGAVRSLPSDGRNGGFLDSITYAEFRAEAYGGRLQIETPIAQPLALLWGADYRNERNERIVDILDPVAFDEDEVARSIEQRTQFPPYFIDQIGLFAQLQWDVSPSFTLSGGIRQEFLGLGVDDYTTLSGDDIEGGNVNFDATVFNAGVVYRATDNVSLFASFSQGFSAPLFFTLAAPPPGFSVDEGFEGLEPQKVDNYEIGVRGRWGNLQASLAGFYTYSELGAFLQNIPGTPNSRLVRAPQRNYGIEAALDWQPTAQWRIGGTVGWNEGEADEDDDGEFTALGTFDVQPWKLTAYVEHQTTPTWSNRLQLLYSGNRDRGFEAGADGLPIEDYITLDLVSQLQIGDGTLSLGIENLLDNQYFPVFSQVLSGFDDTDYRAARGRRVSLTYSISW